MNDKANLQLLIGLIYDLDEADNDFGWSLDAVGGLKIVSIRVLEKKESVCKSCGSGEKKSFYVTSYSERCVLPELTLYKDIPALIDNLRYYLD